MDFGNLANEVATVIRSNQVGTRAIVWSDGSVTSTHSSLNPTVSPGAPNRPMAFFVSGIDTPDEQTITQRLQRAWNSIIAA